MLAFLSGLPHRGKRSGAKTKQNLSTACITALKRPSSAQQSKRRRRRRRRHKQTTNGKAGYSLPQYLPRSRQGKPGKQATEELQALALLLCWNKSCRTQLP